MSHANWHSAGAVDDFPAGVPQMRRLGDTSVGIVRLESDFHAFRDECPHQGAPLCAGRFAGTMLPSAPSTLDYGLQGQVIRCPWHGWEFHVPTGDAVFGISRRRLLKYETEVRGDELYVLVPDRARARAEAAQRRERERA